MGMPVSPGAVESLGTTAAKLLGPVGRLMESLGMLGCTRRYPGRGGPTGGSLATNGAGASGGTRPGSMTGAPATRTGVFSAFVTTIRTGMYLLGARATTLRGARRPPPAPVPVGRTLDELARVLGATMRTGIARRPATRCVTGASVLAESSVASSSLADSGLARFGRPGSPLADAARAD